MRFAKLFTLLLAFTVSASLSAQRYLAPVFSQASKTTVIYGANFTVLPYAAGAGSHSVKQPLVTDVYTPAGDAQTARPLIIYLHTGNFLPYPQNAACGGTRGDSSCVEFANRLAKMGYVVAVADYRLGWNPLASDEQTRRFTLINAAYRGVQDVRTAIRYFRKTVDVGGNPFGIDPNKIVVFGQGTGGYISLAAAYLNTYNEILTTSDPHKFEVPNALFPGGYAPMVLEAYNGDIYATTGPTIVDALYSQGTGGVFPVGDTLCIPNNVGYSSNFNLAVNLGGALGDSTWMDSGEMPLISFQAPTDKFAPCGTDVLNVNTQTGPQPVVEVSGACDMQKYAQGYHLNDVFNTIPAGHDPYGDHAKTINGGLYGFYPLIGTPADNGAPWEWSATIGTTMDCNTSPASAKLYIDTIIGYFAPRACVALGLGCQFSETHELNAFEVGLDIAPVPTVDNVYFSAKELIRHIYVYDLNGRLVKAITSIDANNYTMQRTGLANGLYIAEVRFDEGFVKRKIIFSK
jgi:hypothetical protein